MQCRICHNTENNKIFEAREMMFGFRDKFIYFQCAVCQCLQIAEIPGDMAKYYPQNYYSFASHPTNIKNPIKKLVKNLRNEYAVLKHGLLGKLIYKILPAENLHLLSKIKLSKDSAILDVGCGSGTLLYDLKELGFQNLLAIDPYIKEDIKYHNGLKIIKKSIDEVDGKYDLIMFHHAFEHLSDPLETLRSVTNLLTDNGVCLIRIPTVSSYAWEHYRENWVQLDAPRHFFLHSTKSLDLLAKKVNLQIEKIIYDSTAFQFWGSEQYIKDIPLNDHRSYLVNQQYSIFSEPEISNFQKKAKELNLKNQGDACAFFLKKTRRDG
jgi:SAM-dependent methyltransferase